jgi:uncharacterized OsmC-like protein
MTKKGHKFTEEHKKHLSEARRKWWNKPSNKKRASESIRKRLMNIAEDKRCPWLAGWNKDIPHTQATKDKISQSMKGHEVSNETIRKMVQSQKEFRDQTF